MYRIGTGIDFHKLELNAQRPLVLGGLEIPSPYALVGHSDADIVLHALADAILGALALGDIGDHFPDTDPGLKNMDSALILQKSLDLCSEKSFFPVNIDCTIIAEKPKIAPHRLAIRQSLSQLLSLPLDCVSLKATTTEKMGFIGREEGIEVVASVLMAKNI